MTHTPAPGVRALGRQMFGSQRLQASRGGSQDIMGTLQAIEFARARKEPLGHSEPCQQRLLFVPWLPACGLFLLAGAQVHCR